MWSCLFRFPAAETTTTFRSGSARRISRIFRYCPASAMEEPPNFTTFIFVPFFQANAAIKASGWAFSHWCMTLTSTGLVTTAPAQCFSVFSFNQGSSRSVRT